MSEVSSLDELHANRFYKLTELGAASGLPVSSLRAAYLRGELPGIRTRRTCNAAIRVRAADLLDWIAALASHRQVLSPSEVARAYGNSE